jgi:hypothetical protein
MIGGANGLTSSYISSGCSGSGACVAGSAGTFAEGSYDNQLFQGATPAPTPYTGYSPTAASAGTINPTATNDSGVIYNMINGGCAGGTCNGSALSNNAWIASGAGTIVVPIGLYDVTSVFTLLNNVWGAAGALDTSVIFNFASTPNATTGLQTVVVNLTNASNNGAGTGQIGTSVDCSTTTTVACSADAISTLANSTVINGVTVRTDSAIFDSAYNAATGQFANSAGFVTLDDQVFLFGSAHASQYLVSIGIQELNGVAGSSATALSAITVNGAVASPEPSTVLLFMTGVGLIGAAKFRRRRV